MLYFLLFFIFMSLAAIADQIRLLRSKDLDDTEDYNYVEVEGKIPFKVRLKETLKKLDGFLQIVASSFKETVQEMKQVKRRK